MDFGNVGALHMLQNIRVLVAAASAVFVIGASHGAEPEMKRFRGVVTYHLIPAKVMKVNQIIEDPEPGTSYIGEEGIVLELEANEDLRANWTVVDVEYYRYEEPKIIKYELFGEEHEMTVNYHAERVVVDGDISEYIEE